MQPQKFVAAPYGAGNLRFRGSAESEGKQTAWTMGWIWLGMLALVGMLSLSSWLKAWTRAFWPEQIALVGFFGWWTTGATLVVLVLMVLAVGGRFLTIIQAISRLFHRPATGKAPSTAKMPVAPGSGS